MNKDLKILMERVEILEREKRNLIHTVLFDCPVCKHETLARDITKTEEGVWYWDGAHFSASPPAQMQCLNCGGKFLKHTVSKTEWKNIDNKKEEHHGRTGKETKSKPRLHEKRS